LIDWIFSCPNVARTAALASSNCWIRGPVPSWRTTSAPLWLPPASTVTSASATREAVVSTAARSPSPRFWSRSRTSSTTRTTLSSANTTAAATAASSRRSRGRTGSSGTDSASRTGSGSKTPVVVSRSSGSASCGMDDPSGDGGEEDQREGARQRRRRARGCRGHVGGYEVGPVRSGEPGGAGRDRRDNRQGVRWDVLDRWVRQRRHQVHPHPQAVGELVPGLPQVAETLRGVAKQEVGADEPLRLRAHVDHVGEVVERAVEVALLRVDQVGELGHESGPLVEEHRGVPVRLLQGF